MPFQTGNKLAPGGKRPGAGRKPDAVRQELTDLLNETIDTEDRRDVLRMLSARARSGDVKAIGLLMDRLWGKVPSTNETTEEEEEPTSPLDLSLLTSEELVTLEYLMRKASRLPDTGADRGREGPEE